MKAVPAIRYMGPSLMKKKDDPTPIVTRLGKRDVEKLPELIEDDSE